MNDHPIETKNYMKPKKNRNPMTMLALGFIIGAVAVTVAFFVISMANQNSSGNLQVTIPSIGTTLTNTVATVPPTTEVTTEVTVATVPSYAEVTTTTTATQLVTTANTVTATTTVAVTTTSTTITTVATTTADTTTTTSVHIHKFGEWEIVISATCTETGKMRSVCECGEEMTKEVSANGHTTVIDSGYPATKTEDGLTDGRHCSVCKKVLTEQKIIYAGSRGLAYRVTSNATCEITGIGTCKDVDLVIPRSIDGYMVTSIADRAFDGCESVINIIILNGVVDIGEYAFYRCRCLTSIDIPNSVKSIGSDAFTYCSSLKNITIPDGITTISSWSFALCSSLTTVRIPDSVKIIGEYAFANCHSLESVNIPNGATCIDGFAFSNCHSLTSLIIPDSITSIGESSFRNCSSLINIIIPDGTTKIGKKAFEECCGLTSVTIAKSVANIGDYAFNNCTALTNITYKGIISKWKTISKGSLWDYGTGPYTVYCEDGIAVKNGNVQGLLYKTASDTTCEITGIGSYTDANLVIPTYIGDYKVTKIGTSAFRNCDNLESVEIPNSIITIGDSAFLGCEGLLSIVIPNSVTGIGNDAFVDCFALTNISVLDGNSAYKSIDGVLFTYDEKVLICYPAGKKDALYEIPSMTTNINKASFADCYFLTSITISGNIISIGEYSFYGCCILESIIYNNTVSEWNSIAKGENWNYGTPDYTVYCIDGTITKSGTVTYN